MARSNGPFDRREPVLGEGAATRPSGRHVGGDLRLSAADRPAPTGRPARSAEAKPEGTPGRREPRLDGVPAGADDFDRNAGPYAEDLNADPRRARGVAAEAGLASRRAKGSGARRPERARRKRSFIGHIVRWTFLLGLWAVISAGGIVAYQFAKLPPIDQLAVPKRAPNIAIVAADGSLIANKGDMGGRAIDIKELPPYLPKAFVAIEDRRFYDHLGIDPAGIGRALLRNVSAGGVSQGGSTLTQQLAKNLFLTQDRTMSRKIQEAILSIWLEQKYTKDQILELYLNRVYFGSSAYGVEAAAQRYFGKPAKDVTLAEAAMLAGLVQAPSRLAPNRNAEAAQARAGLVLAAMAQEGFVSDQKAKAAMMTPAMPVKHAGPGSANYAADYVMDVLDDFVGSIEQDIVVRTTIDPALQSTAERALVEELGQKSGKFGVSQGAVVTLAADGALKALVGGRNYADSQFNRATVAKRQPGSSFKPFVYLAAMERGLTPDTVREDGPVNIRGWTPENYSRRYSGPMTLSTALAHSINTIAVKLGVEVGAKTVVRTAQRLGITSPLQTNASIALGTSEVTPIELVAAYTAFANGGIGVIPYVILSVKQTDGKALYTRVPTSLGPVIDPKAVGMMNAMLRDVVTGGTAKSANLPGWDVGGKTGTSQDFRDAWFVGFTSQVVTGVWLGNDDNSSTKHATGGSLPIDIWNRVMKVATRNLKPTPLPGIPYISNRAPAVAWSDAPRAAPPQPQPGRNDDGAAAPQPVREKNFFEKLFGG